MAMVNKHKLTALLLILTLLAGGCSSLGYDSNGNPITSLNVSNNFTGPQGATGTTGATGNFTGTFTGNTTFNGDLTLNGTFIQKSINNSIYSWEALYNPNNSVSNWSKIYTISPSSVSNVYTRGYVEWKWAGDVSGVGNGILISKWYFDYANGAPSVGTFGLNITSGAQIQFRLIPDGNDVWVEVASDNLIHSFGGIIDTLVFIPKPSGTPATFTVN